MPVFGTQMFGSGGVGAYEIDNSCRFYSGDSTYMQRDYGAGGNTKLWTMSFWIKRTKFGYENAQIFGAGDSITYTTDGLFDDDDRFRLWNYADGYQMRLITTPVFRDPSAWYHIVVAYDSAQSTAADRVTISFNGVKITAFDTEEYPAQDLDSYLGSDVRTGFGRYISYEQGPYLDAYLAEVHYVNGSAQAVTAFGETNDDGVWVPKEYGGSYGTGGFFLDFEDSSDLGKDVSGSSNDMTTSGLAAADQMSDTPTDNFATWNPLIKSTNTYSDGNLKVVNAGSVQAKTISTIGVISGKWYMEIAYTGNSSWPVGIAATSEASDYLSLADSLGWWPSSSNTQLYINGSEVDDPWDATTWTSGDTVGLALNVDDEEVSIYQNGSIVGAAVDYSSYNWSQLFFGVGNYIADNVYTANFGQSSFSETPPTGFKALSTANLAAPAITDPSAQFQTQLYTGDGVAIGSGGQAITFTGNSSLSPDLVWIKNRDAADSHALYDSVRGTTEQLESDTYAAETTEAEGLTTFGVDGFTVGDLDQVNTNTEDYVSWNWAEGATPGFDIVSYTGDGANRTISHSLGAVPKMIAVKMRSDTYEWTVYHEAMGNTKMMKWNTSEAPSTASTFWQDTTPTSSVFSLGTHGNVNKDTETFIAYLWAEVDGFSKFGSYTGNGNADGPFVYCGFKPALVICKKSSAGDSWCMFDLKRNTYNLTDQVLKVDTTAAEATDSQAAIDILSNGFKLRVSGSRTNLSDGTFIFMAWAENPFGGDGVAPATAR